MAIDFKPLAQQGRQKSNIKFTPTQKTPVQPPEEKKSFLQKAGEFSGEALETAGEYSGIFPLARSLEKPFVSVAAGFTGNQSPIKTPFGEVKPYTSGKTMGTGRESLESLGEAASLGLTALGMKAAPNVVGSKAASNKLLQYIMPKMGKAEAEAAAAAGESGTVRKGLTGLFKESVAPTAQHVEQSAAVKGIVKPTQSFAKNITNLKTAIRDTSEKRLRPWLEKLPGSWNKNTLTGYLNEAKTAVPKGLVGDTEKIYNRVFDVAMDEVKAAESKGWNSLWEVRKSVDRAIENNFGEKFLGNESRKPKDAAVKAVRNAINKYLDEGTSAAAKANGMELEMGYKTTMSKMHNMFDVLANLEEKRTDEIMGLGESAIKQFTKRHPVITEAAKTAIGIAGYEKAKRYIPGMD